MSYVTMVLEAHTLLGTEYLDTTKLNKTTPDIIDNIGVQIFFCIIYAVIFLLGIFGNVLVCYVVIRNKAMQTVTNMFITNLALSDILLCVLAVPFTPLYSFLGEWTFGRIMCHLMPYAQGCSVYISTLTLTSIAIDRYFVIIHPFRPRMKFRTSIILIISIWAISLFVTCPYGLFMAIQITDNKTFCEEQWPSERSRKIFGTATTVMQFLLPFFIITFCYTCVSYRLNERAKSKPGSKSSKREEADRERKKRTNRMLIAMVAIFGISWLPLNLINISIDFNDTLESWPYMFTCFFVAHTLAMASTCYNPFLYAWLNENFRKEFKLVLPCFDGALNVRGSVNSGNMQHHMITNVCNGNNDTQQDSLLNPAASFKHGKADGGNKRTDRDSGFELESLAPDQVKYSVHQTEGAFSTIDDEKTYINL